MDYKEQVEQAKRAAQTWREKHQIVGAGDLRVDLMVADLTHSITALLARAENAESQAEMFEMENKALKNKIEAAEARAEKAERDLNKLLEEEEKEPFDPFRVKKEE